MKYLFEILPEDSSILLMNQLCSTLNAIVEILSSSSSVDICSYKLLKYLYR